ncbi:MAG TPA: o-succinylbenzoate--CoA ligase [Thermoleophilaceae bacterium]|nr:o-succinylbenzoate--CoA ligase [Thermoleophilaceae bacterium]
MDDWLTRHGEHPALITAAGATTYAELAEGAARTARRLAALGVREGQRVATTLPPSLAFAELLHALPLIGASLVPLNTRLTSGERRWQLEDSGARLCVEEPLDGEEAEIEARRAPDLDSEHSVIYTSGTTGRPTAVSLTHRNHIASALASAWNLGVDPGDRWLGVLPLFHVGGLAVLLRSAIYGTTAVLHDGFDVERVKDAFEQGEVTLASLVPTMLRRLVEAGLESAPALRAVLLGGGPVPRDLLEWSAQHDFPALQTYGMTQTSSQIATLTAAEAVTKAGSAGRPLLGVELSISGEGEILARGPMISPGALDPADGWLHTGDRGRLDDEGYLWVEGRLKDVIVTGGENVACAEVERVLEAHPAVVEAAVVGLPDPEWGELVTAFVVLDGEPGGDLIAHCRERLAGYKVPRALHVVDALPRNAAGKLLRRDLVR